MSRWIATGLLACTLAAAGCSGNSHEAASTPAPAPSIANPVDFPLYANAHVLAAKNYTETINTAGNATSAAALSQGAGTYTGHEVVASTPASFAQLSAWLHGLGAKPPHGYTTATASSLDRARVQAHRVGLDFAAFQTQKNGKNVGMLVVVMDPALVSTKLGPVLDLIGRYRMLPSAMRSQIDSQVQSRIGMSVSDAMQPDSPVGAALSALDQFQHSNARGILLIDAAKQ